MLLTATFERQVELLQSHGLHTSVKLLAEFMLSSVGPGGVKARSMDPTVPAIHLQVSVDYADALYELEEYRRAEHQYRDALRQRQTQPRVKTRDNATPPAIRVKIAKCLMKVGEQQQALHELQLVPAEQRTPAMHMLVAKLLEQAGSVQMASASYQQALRECPLALEALLGLVRMGMSPEKLLASVSGLQGTGELRWLRQWLDGHAFAHKHNYARAVEVHTSLSSQFTGNAELLISAAAWQWKQGYLPAAKQAFERARAADPLNLDQMEVFAHVLLANGRLQDLNKLASQLLDVGRNRVEPWLAAARYQQLLCENSDDGDQGLEHARRGLAFADRAIALDSFHSESFMVKGTLLLAVDQLDDAAASFRQAYNLERSFAAYQGLVSCYSACNRVKEALMLAKEAHQQMPSNPRVITLLGQACAQCTGGNAKARKAFSNALAHNPKCMDAVFALVALEMAEKNYSAAVDLLERHLHDSRTDYVYRRIGDICMMMKDYEKALQNYSTALSFNPDYKVAKRGAAMAMRRVDGLPDPEGEEGDEVGGEDASILSI